MKLRSVLPFLFAALVFAWFASPAEGQDEQWLKDLVEESHRQQEEQRRNPQTPLPPPPEKPTDDWAGLANVFGEMLLAPDGETEAERRQRMQGLAGELIGLNNTSKQQHADYNRARRNRFNELTTGVGTGQITNGGRYESGGGSGGGGSGSSAYQSNRDARLGPTNGTGAEAPSAASNGSGQTVAGYSEANAEKFYKRNYGDEPASSNASSAGASSDDWGDDIDSYSRKGDKLKDGEKAEDTDYSPTEYCECKGDDYTDALAIMCFSRATTYDSETGDITHDDVYLSDYFPMTPQCFRSVMSYQGPAQE